jgi:hypothetical protein
MHLTLTVGNLVELMIMMLFLNSWTEFGGSVSEFSFQVVEFVALLVIF